jgi:hypothetical protein
MQDFIYHEDAQREEELIQEEILRRYRRHFEESSMKVSPTKV